MKQLWSPTDGYGGSLILPDYLEEELARAARRPTAVDLFCGCGGFSLGFIQAGYQVLAGVDWDVDAAITYTVNLGTYPLQFHFGSDDDRQRLEKNLSKAFKRKGSQVDAFETAGSGWISHENPRPPGVGHFFLGDISKLTGRDILDPLGLEPGELDAVIGSPPCQGFSRGNKNSGPNDPRNELIFEWARLVCEMRPKACVMENVPQVAKMTTADGLPILDAVTRALEDGDFAGLDSLRASLKQQKGITFMRNKRSKKSRARAAEETATESQGESMEGDDEEAA